MCLMLGDDDDDDDGPPTSRLVGWLQPDGSCLLHQLMSSWWGAWHLAAAQPEPAPPPQEQEVARCAFQDS